MIRIIIGVVLFVGFHFAFLGSSGVLDYDEAAYAEVSKEMFRSGNWSVPRLGDQEFFEKPVFVYWTHLLSYSCFGVGEWGVRFFNAFAALGLAGAVFGFAHRGLGGRGACLAALVMATALAPAALARVSLTDTWLTLWLTLCVGFFHRSDEARRNGGRGLAPFMASCACAGLAMLTKGAVGALLPVVVALAYLLVQGRSLFVFQPRYSLPGGLLLLGVGTSWYLWVGLTHPAGFSFLSELFWEHHVGRFLAAKQGHAGSLLYYVPVLLLGLWPWTGVLLADRSRSLGRSRGEGARLVLVFLILSAATLLFFSLAATKLPNYMAPAFPGLALLVGARLSASPPARGRAWSRTVAMTAGSFALLGVVFLWLPELLAALPSWLGEEAVGKAPGLARTVPLGLLPWGMASLLLGGSVWIAIAGLRGSRTNFAVATGMSIAAAVLSITAAVWPAYDRHFARPLRELAVRAADAARSDRPVVLLGLKHLPSVAFYGGKSTRYVSRRDAAGVASLFASAEPEVLITTEHYLRTVLLPVAPAGGPEIVARSGGYVAVSCSTPSQ